MPYAVGSRQEFDGDKAREGRSSEVAVGLGEEGKSSRTQGR